MDGGLLGGISRGLKDPKEETIALAAKHKGDAEAKLEKEFQNWDLVGYATQIAGGINYFLKIKTAEDSYAHVTVWQKTSGETEMTDASEGHTLDAKF